MANAIYAGTFDPFTHGHRDILRRALKVFDDVVILIAESQQKKPLIPLDDRINNIMTLFQNESRVSVDSWDGLLVDYARTRNIHHVVRGLRATGDFEYEYQMAMMNGQLFPELETHFLLTGPKYNFISSSLVKEVYAHGGDISPFVPAEVLELLNKQKAKSS